MKPVKVESRKFRKAAKPRRVSGVQVRSGIKAGILEVGGPGGPFGEKPGLPGRRLG